ncbi:hypothetical protein QFZ73_005241 [Peribacillus sp. V2I11]|nr:hypothetical protein [Peribacillus sp. V2I11]
MEKLELLYSEWETGRADFLKFKENRPKDKEVRNQS